MMYWADRRGAGVGLRYPRQNGHTNHQALLPSPSCCKSAVYTSCVEPEIAWHHNGISIMPDLLQEVPAGDLLCDAFIGEIH